MTTATQRQPKDRASKFVQEALLSPNQANDVVLIAKQPEQDPNGPTHAHGDYGHGDTGHADY
jgi:hypothetical protein